MIGFNYLGKMGQLGNQMFQYSFGQHLSRIHKEKVYYDIEFFKKKN